MPVRNSTLFRRFVNGASHGRNHNVIRRYGDEFPSLQIQELPNGNTVLIGYGWAKYAEKDSETGDVTVYAGWREWAFNQMDNQGGYPTTARHIDNLIQTLEPTSVVDLLNPSYTVREDSFTPEVAETARTVREIGRLGRHQPEAVEAE